MIDILIPVLDRPNRAMELVRNITRATRCEHHVLFLCSQGDEMEIEACRATGADVCVMPFPAGPADFAKKINIGYRNTDCEFFQVGADDLIFYQDWDREALEMAKHPSAGVIGTNDLHNPRVKRGLSATHPLIRRAYIEEWGGTFDGTGAVFCELYDHQYVDDELAQTAQARRQWVFAKESKVEHVHPYFGKQPMDDTYRKALRNTQEDWVLFNRRMRSMRRYVPRERLLKARNRK